MLPVPYTRSSCPSCRSSCFLVIFQRQNIAQWLFFYYFFQVLSPWESLPTLSSPASCRLHDPFTPGCPPLFTHTGLNLQRNSLKGLCFTVASLTILFPILFLSGPDVNCDIAIAIPSPAVGYAYTHPANVSSDVKHLTSAAMSPASPASSVSSFSMPSQVPKVFQGGSFVAKPLFQAPFPEVNSLSKVLTLSDSCVNYFSDKCYDSVSLCSCSKLSEGTRTKGSTTKGKDIERCVCGFGPLEGMKFTAGTGLFPDDVSATSMEIVKPLKKESVLKPVIEVKKECTTSLCAKRRGSTTAIVPSQVPFCLLEEILSQCSSPFACSNLKYQLMYKGHHGIVKQVSGVSPQNKGELPVGNNYYKNGQISYSFQCSFSV